MTVDPTVDPTGRPTVDPTGQGESTRPEASGRSGLQRILDDVVAAGAVGITLRVHDRQGGWTGTAGRGRLDADAPPPVDGHVRIGSNTKTFVATLVLNLVAEGRLGLDDPAADHLPAFGLDPRITVRMLLQHTSGVFNFTGEFYEDGTVVPGITWQGKAWVESRFRTHPPEELVALALSHEGRFEPGTDWSYSNTNYVLARLLVEHVTGRAYAEELQRVVAGPLGLTGTLAPATAPDVPEPHAHAYYRYEEDGRAETVDVTRQNPSWISAGGDMISTTQDLHTFFAALMRGRLLPAPLLDEMRTPHPKAGYGLGVFVQETPGGTVVTHNGGIAGHAALMFATPDGRTTLTAALNYVDDPDLSMGATYLEATQRLVAAVFGAPAEAH